MPEPELPGDAEVVPDGAALQEQGEQVVEDRSVPGEHDRSCQFQEPRVGQAVQVAGDESLPGQPVTCLRGQAASLLLGVLAGVIGGAPGLDARPWFIGFGLLSVGVATLLLIYARDFKRMFAFSTVEHMGIILVAAGLGGAEAHLGAAYQMTGHAIAKSFCFFAAGAIAMTYDTQEIASIRGLVRFAPWSALALVAGAFAITGAPPFAIFISELVIFKAGIASGQYLTIALLASACTKSPAFAR